jgi:APA family basic amino acid/polyamine antiporter
MIGPILGSGVVLLPPMAYGMLGGRSIWAWLVIMGLGALFAMIFAKLTVLHPGDGGMTNAIEASLGKKVKLYASILMISAVSFGPTAVMLTAAEYLNKLNILNSVSKPIIAIVLVLLGMVALMRDTKFISTLSFVLSSIIGVTFLASSIVVLMKNGIHIAPLNSLEPVLFGKTVLLLFWAIIGWEVMGNYSNQVRDINKTIPLATAISIIVITTVYLVMSLAIQSFPYSETLSLVEVIKPIFGESAKWVLALLVTSLCFCAYMLMLGALSRLINTLSVEGYLPSIFKKKNNDGVPVSGVMYFIIVHLLVLLMNLFGIIDIERIINIANSFFLMNAVIGLIAAMRIIDSKFYKASSLVLAVSLLVILSFSSADVLIALIVIYGVVILIERRQRYMLESLKSLE